MVPAPEEHTLVVTPAERTAFINLSQQVKDEVGDLLAPYAKAAYCSYHTTAGFLDQRLAKRLGHDPQSLQQFVGGFQQLFPPDADYRHDQIHLRTELSEAQKATEPRNADSHLTFISSGLNNCVTYQNDPEMPVYLIDLDGVNGSERRRRRAKVIGFNEEQTVAQVEIPVPVSGHPIDSVNLWDPRLGLYEQLHDQLAAFDIQKGRVELRLAQGEQHTGLTVNEYETLLMQHDLVEVLRNPFRFMAEKGKNMLKDPRAIPVKAKDYAKYDLVHIVNQFIDALGLNESLVERVLDKFVSVPASRFLRMKRGVNLLVSDDQAAGQGRIVKGTYQSPILVQWRKADSQTRIVEATFYRFA